MESSRLKAMELLVTTVQRFSIARDLTGIITIARTAARQLTGADGASIILRDGDRCHYVDEDAISPLWKGKRFPMSACVSGWAMLHREHVAIEDIYRDPRVPIDAYRPTFVKSLAMMPIRISEPIGAIGIYWADHHKATPDEMHLLQSLADSASSAIEAVTLQGELRQALGAAQLAREELQRQLDLRDEFISVAGHELKTPLTPMILQNQIFERMQKTGAFAGNPKEAEFRKFLEISGRQLWHLAKLVDNLLDVTRIRLGKLAFQFEEGVDLSRIAGRVVEQYQPLTPAPISMALAPAVCGRWDPVKLEQVVGNLVSNAVRYGQSKPIRVSVAAMPSGARFEVEDEGHGVAKEDQGRIFERFERASPMHNYGGMGLGLYVTHQIVRGMGGTIRVESELGQGSRFTVELPLRN